MTTHKLDHTPFVDIYVSLLGTPRYVPSHTGWRHKIIAGSIAIAYGDVAHQDGVFGCNA
jgi:hypothetical protein